MDSKAMAQGEKPTGPISWTNNVRPNVMPSLAAAQSCLFKGTPSHLFKGEDNTVMKTNGSLERDNVVGLSVLESPLSLLVVAGTGATD